MTSFFPPGTQVWACDPRMVLMAGWLAGWRGGRKLQKEEGFSLLSRLKLVTYVAE